MKLNVLLVSNQVRGIDGTGGLGDVAYALPKALSIRDDIDIRVIMPGFKNISNAGLDDRFSNVIIPNLNVPFGSSLIPVDVCQFHLNNGAYGSPHVVCYLLRSDWFEKATDSPEQAILLSRATVEFLRYFHEFRPDLIHCNDWHTGLIPVYLNTIYKNDPYLGRIATLYTTHNTGYGYQGAFPNQDISKPNQVELLRLAGLSQSEFIIEQTHSVEHMTLFNFAKGGFGFSDLINTVSLTYAREIQTPAFGGGFNGLLVERSHDLAGVVDGIDTQEWNPGEDPYIAPNNYCISEPVDTIRCKKQHIKIMLQRWKDKRNHPIFESINTGSILVSIVGRIADQKYPIFLPALEDMSQVPGIQVIIVGSAHPLDRQGQVYARQTAALAEKYRDRIFFYNGFDIPLSHLAYAASDILLMPSMYEPCGLTQMIAMRYGAVPVVRAVGGLEDTIVDELTDLHATGFKFKEISTDHNEMADIPAAVSLLLDTTKRAARVMRENPARWGQLIKNGMAQDFSWSIAAPQYMKLYAEAVNRRIQSHFLL